MKNKIYGLKYIEKTTSGIEGGKMFATTVSYELTGGPGHPQPDQQTDGDIEIFGIVIGA